MTAAKGAGLVVDVFTDPSCPSDVDHLALAQGSRASADLELRWRSYTRNGGELPASAG